MTEQTKSGTASFVAYASGPARQAEALLFKTVAYQKRQLFTNICCISLCPLFMVGIAAALGMLINTLIIRSTALVEFNYCSNVPSMNALNMPYISPTAVPHPKLTVTPSSGIAAATLSSIYNANYALVRSLKVDGPPGAAASLFRRMCVTWYGDEYPQSALYERPSGAVGDNVRDATYFAQPIGGWIGALASGNPEIEQPMINIVNINQIRSWALFGVAPGVDASLVGVRPPTARNITGLLSTAFAAPFKVANVSAGLFDTYSARYYADFVPVGNNSVIATSFTSVPWYNATLGGSNALDDAISASLKASLIEIAKLDKSVFLAGTANSTELQKTNAQIALILNSVPHGAIYFTKIDHATKKYAMDFHFGNDKRLLGSSTFPLSGQRMIPHLTQLSNAILRMGNPALLGAAKITQGLRIMPQVASNALNIPFGGIIGSILFPFGVSFLLPIFAIILVQEKEKRILILMKMNGVKTAAYYISHYVAFFLLYMISAFFFLITGYNGKLTLFTLTDSGVLILFLFVWGNNLISLAFFFSTLFNKSRTALSTLI